jgi:tetratricopeptide (TPR) repeat protein
MKRFWVIALLIQFVASADTFQDLSTRATAARQANNVPQAIELYRQALNLNSGWQEGWWFLGTLLYDSDQYAAGRDAFQHFVDLNSQATPGLAFLGLCEFETGDYANSLEHIQRALALGADKDDQLAPALVYHEALLQTQKGDFDAALQTYAGIVHGMRNTMPNEPMLVSIGLAALRAAQVPKQIEQSQSDLFAAAGKVAYFVFAGDYASADAGFAELTRGHPATANVHYMHAVYLMARDPDAAFQEFRRELEVAPENRAADAMLAFALLTRGDPDEALPYAQKASEPEDSTAFAKYVYGRALTETGDVQRGLKYLEQSAKTDPSNADVHVTLAAAYSKAGQPVQARHEREVAMQMESRNQAIGRP